jgi:hypothetical protein
MMITQEYGKVKRIVVSPGFGQGCDNALTGLYFVNQGTLR